LKRVKELNLKLIDLTEIYQKSVLEVTDELELLGQLPPGHSKDYSKKIIDLCNLVPPKELEA
jgi:hypothetical protein